MHSISRLLFPRGVNLSVNVRGFQCIAVVGGGLMGSGIAQVCAQNGLKVNLFDMNEAVLSKAVSTIRENALRVAQKKYPLDNSAAAAFVDACVANLETSTEFESSVGDADLVIEAIVENLAAKQSLFKQLEDCCSPNCVLVSNTSSLSLEAIGRVLLDPARFAGLHFFQPVPVLRLVEVVRTVRTSEFTFQALMEFVRFLGKVPISCRDTPGFVVNRLLLPYLLDAMRMVERGDATPHDVDLGMKLGAAHPMGPFELADYVGLDTLMYICESLTDQLADDPTFMCPAILHRLVQEGRLGRKTGRGFFKYGADGKILSDNHS